MDRIDEGAQTTAVNFVVNGTAGAGYIELIDQSVAPANTATRLYATSNHLAVRESGGWPAIIDSSALTAPRTFELPDIDGPIVTKDATQTLANKTILSAANNTIDASLIKGTPVSGTPVIGDVISYTGISWAPLTLAANSPLSYSSGTFSATVGSSAGTLAAGNDNRFATPQIIQVKPTLAGAGQFTSIFAAIASITDSGPLKPYVIAIAPGIYTEPPLVIPQYTTINGSGPAATYIKTSMTGITLITYSIGCALRDCSLVGAGGVGSIAAHANSVGTVYLSRSVISGFETHVLVQAATSACAARLIEVNSIGAFVNAIHLDGRAITGTNAASIGATSLVIAGITGATSGVLAEGPYATLTLTNSNISGLITGSGILVRDGSTSTFTATRSTGNFYGVNVANVGAGPNINCESVAAANNINDVTIANPTATGSFAGVADLSKVSNSATGNFPFNFIDSLSQSNAVLGDFVFQPTQAANAAEIGDLWTYTAALGKYTGGTIAAGVGLTFTVAAGEGYVAHGNFPTQHLFKVIWAGWTSPTLAASTTYYVYVDEFGVNFNGSLPNPTSQILLGRVRTTATGIEFIDSQNTNNYHPVDAVRTTFRYAIGALYANGSIVTANASRQLAISSGRYFYLNNEYNPSGQVSPANFYAYYHSAGVFTRAAATVVDNAQYDDGVNLTAIPAGLFVKHSFYIVGSGATEQYFLVYGQATYATIQLAQAGANPTPPNYFNEGIFMLASFIVQQGVAALADIIDNRPTIGSTGASFAGVTDHGNLTGLLDDDHPQYLLVNGSRNMSGTLNMGSNNITNAGTINTVDIAAHASRHLPNGADPLTSAAPLTNLSSVTTNTVGTANSFARSDHTHAIDITGFGINSLSGTLGTAKGGTGLTTLPLNSFLSVNGAGAIEIAAPKAIINGAVVGTTDSQTLTNKTITDSTNTVWATHLRSTTAATPVNVTAALPTSTGQVLTVTNAGPTYTAAWQTPATALIDSTTFIVDTPNTTRRLGFDVANTINSSDVILRTNKTNAGTSYADIPHFAANDTFVMVGVQQTLTNKTLTSPSINNIVNGAVTLSLPGVSTTLVGTGTGDTLTNKTIKGASNDVEANALKTTGSPVVINSGGGPSVGFTLVATSNTSATWQNPNAAIVDNTIFIVNATDSTNRIGFDINGNASTTLTLQSTITGDRTITIPNLSDTLAVVSSGQTLTNKTITDAGSTVYAKGIMTSGSPVIIGTGAPTAGQILQATSATAAAWQNPALIDTQLTIVDSSDNTKKIAFDAAGSASTTTTIASSQTTNRTITLPDATTTLVGTGTGDTLTNKTITDANNTVYTKGFITGVSPSPPVLFTGAPLGAGYTLITTSTTAASWIKPGNVIGPASSTANAIVRYADATGTLLKNSPTFILDDSGDLYTLNTVRLTTGINGSSGLPVLNFTDNAKSVNYIGIINALTGNAPQITAIGTDSDIRLDLIPKNTPKFETTLRICGLDQTLPTPGYDNGLDIIIDGDNLGISSLRIKNTSPQAYEFPVDESGVIILSLASQLLDNKTFTSNCMFQNGAGTIKIVPAVTNIHTITITTTTGQNGAFNVNIPAIAANETFILANAIQTLSNKTLTSPSINNIISGGFTLSLPTQVTTLVGRNTTDNLSNKTLVSPSITNTDPATSTLTFSISGTTNTIIASNQTSANRTFTIPQTTANDTFVTADFIQTLTNKTLVSPSITNTVAATSTLTFSISGTTNTIIASNQTSATRTFTIPQTTANDTFVMAGFGQTLTNKTITDAGSTVYAKGIMTSGAAVVIANTPPIAGRILQATSATAAAWQNPTLIDTQLTIVDSADNTIKIAFDAAGSAGTTTTITSSQTTNRTITLPNATTTLVGTDTTDTLTNKTITDAGSTVYAKGIMTTGAAVIIDNTPPTAGAVLVATSATGAQWRNQRMAVYTNASLSFSNAGVTTTSISTPSLSAGVEIIVEASCSISLTTGSTDTVRIQLLRPVGGTIEFARFVVDSGNTYPVHRKFSITSVAGVNSFQLRFFTFLIVSPNTATANNIYFDISYA